MLPLEIPLTAPLASSDCPPWWLAAGVTADAETHLDPVCDTGARPSYKGIVSGKGAHQEATTAGCRS